MDHHCGAGRDFGAGGLLVDGQNGLRRDVYKRQVQLLRERSVRLQEQSFRSTTHSAVVRALAERGIPLYDPAAPGEIIEE